MDRMIKEVHGAKGASRLGQLPNGFGLSSPIYNLGVRLTRVEKGTRGPASNAPMAASPAACSAMYFSTLFLASGSANCSARMAAACEIPAALRVAAFVCSGSPAVDCLTGFPLLSFPAKRCSSLSSSRLSSPIRTVARSLISATQRSENLIVGLGQLVERAPARRKVYSHGNKLRVPGPRSPRGTTPHRTGAPCRPPGTWPGGLDLHGLSGSFGEDHLRG